MKIPLKMFSVQWHGLGSFFIGTLFLGYIWSDPGKFIPRDFIGFIKGLFGHPAEPEKFFVGTLF